MTQMNIPSFGGNVINAILATPAGGHGEGLILLAEANASPEQREAFCASFAAKGYLALCPLLAQKQGERPDPEVAMGDLLSVLAFLRTQPGCGGKVGVLGFEQGGLLAFLLAARSDVDCAVAYTGTSLAPHLGEVHDLRMPFLLHLAAPSDPHKAAETARIARSLSRNKVITTHVYENTEEAFFHMNRGASTLGVAQDAQEKTLAFLSDHLNH